MRLCAEVGLDWRDLWRGKPRVCCALHNSNYLNGPKFVFLRRSVYAFGQKQFDYIAGTAWKQHHVTKKLDWKLDMLRCIRWLVPPRQVNIFLNLHYHRSKVTEKVCAQKFLGCLNTHHQKGKLPIFCATHEFWDHLQYLHGCIVSLTDLKKSWTLWVSEKKSGLNFGHHFVLSM